MVLLARTDYHFHTNLSFDGRDPLLDFVRRAAADGIEELCVTDHYECGGAFRKNNTAILTMRETFFKAYAQNDTPVRLRFGVELGEALHDRGAAEVALSEGKFDFVIASVHNLRGRPDFKEIDYHTAQVDEMAGAYYDEIEELIEWGRFDVLGHLNYFERYAAKQGVSLDLHRFYPRLADLFVKLIAAGKGIEVNTSGLFGPLGRTLPEDGVLRLYRGLGGRIVTIGSDSHTADGVGRGYDEAAALLKRCGFDEITLFEEHTPRQIKL